MKENKSKRVVLDIAGVLMIFLAQMVAPMPTANRWLTKMGHATNNLPCYGPENPQTTHRLSRSL